jgi:hypothetical protein
MNVYLMIVSDGLVALLWVLSRSVKEKACNNGFSD